MNHDYIIPNEWSIIEQGFDPRRVMASESLFSLGNGAMGQRANFEECYSGDTFRGSYIAGVYYPDKTRVGWWKNGYPEYFAKVPNAPNWIGIDVRINDEILDLARCQSISHFRRELNMKEGWYERSFEARMQSGIRIRVISRRFLSLDHDELGAIRYSVTPLDQAAKIWISPYIDSGVRNENTNWDERFWETLQIDSQENRAWVVARTFKTQFDVATFMQSNLSLDGRLCSLDPELETTATSVYHHHDIEVPAGSTVTVIKFGGYVSSRNHKPGNLIERVKMVLDLAGRSGYEGLLNNQKKAWADIWKSVDIVIEGDIRAQQGIRFNIYHLNQTYLGKDHRLNIGPKGFTGEKYGGSTYWDSEAYCLPFFMATKGREVARNLLKYRYNHLDKAIANAKKMGFVNGAALYPMVTMDGEECHNEWEITFEEIHRNGAILFAIYNYVRYTGDYDYVPAMGLEVMIAIARFWRQRANISPEKNKYVILGVTGPNEYENNVNNNWYTNYLARWCLQYTVENIRKVEIEYPDNYKRIRAKTALSDGEIEEWMEVATQIYLPWSEKHGIFLQQDGFLDKESLTVADIPVDQLPINQHWSWDRILRSPFIKQADVLQGFYFFEDHFSGEKLEKHYDYYERLTVHESSLSPCIHSILASSLGRIDEAYKLYLRTSRLDLDDYNKEVHEGLHITSMAGTWLSIVEGFGGMRIKDGMLSFNPKIPESWSSYSFKINFRNYIIQIKVHKEGVDIYAGDPLPFPVWVDGHLVAMKPEMTVKS